MKYTTNRKYRDFVEVEPTKKIIKKKSVLRKEKSFLDKIKDFFKSK